MTGIYEFALRQGAMFGGLFAITLVSYLVFNALVDRKSK